MKWSTERRTSRTLLAGMLILSGATSRPTVAIQEVGSPRSAPGELREYIARFAGSSPTNCGQFLLVRPLVTASAAELEQAVACGRDAARGRKPFWTAKQDQGIDSLLFQGLVGTSEGTVYRFSYDSAPCGGPGCPGRFTVERCAKPAIATDRADNANFICPR